jgi:PiT family inorganic phosphate transporter
MTLTLVLVVTVIVVALCFDFVNGFNDAANAIATIVVTRALTPLQAVILAAAGNFFGCLFFGTAVAKMIGHGIVHVESVTLTLLIATLFGAILWQITTWRLALPTSSSHALIGGLIGSGIASAGFKVVVWHGVLKIFSFIIIAPLIGIIGSIIFSTIVIWIFHKTTPTVSESIFKKLQLVTAASVSIGHGTNDAQKTMGIIALALFTGHFSNSFEHGEIDRWVVIAAYTAISLGTLCGGWRIVKTMGTSITKIRAMEGFCSNAAASVVLIATAHAGIPVSTTHVIAGSIMGVGTVRQAGTVRWITARKIIWAWVITIPMASLFAGGTYLLLTLFLPR